MNELRNGESCEHPGCLQHVSHPCEGCGRIGGRPAISMENLNKVAQAACRKAGEEYRSTCAKCHRGEDLPGIWPFFYLYADMTWDIGYKPTGHMLSELGLKDWSSRELLDDLISNLSASYAIFNPHKPVEKEATSDHGTTDHVAEASHPDRRGRGHARESAPHAAAGQAIPPARKRARRTKAVW